MRLTATIIILCTAQLLLSQVPEAFTYQGIARNSDGSTLQNSLLGLQLSILENDLTGQAVYTERNTSTTTGIGHFSVQVGRGDVTSGDFNAIDWTSEKLFLRIEMDINGGTDYNVLFTAPLSAVPYAYVVDKSDNGPLGRSGPDGPEGEAGAPGPQGPQGPEGQTGAQGPKGPRGSTGPAGATGPAGPEGDAGPTGAQGPQGPIGNPGADGANGPQGATGTPGPKGLEGAKGPAGDQGPQGSTPANGVQGPRGPEGPQGLPGGPTGEVGDQGPSGPQGLSGRTGSKGQTGDRFYNEESFNITSTVPANPQQGQMYIDDGTNRTDGLPGFRVFDGLFWFDL